MARDKAKDDKWFNCSQEHELIYVAGLYAQSKIVYDFLKSGCVNGIIKNKTHLELYKMIQEKFGYSIPV